jgi:hypothetical protein
MIKLIIRWAVDFLTLILDIGLGEFKLLFSHLGTFIGTSIQKNKRVFWYLHKQIKIQSYITLACITLNILLFSCLRKKSFGVLTNTNFKQPHCLVVLCPSVSYLRHCNLTLYWDISPVFNPHKALDFCDDILSLLLTVLGMTI